MSQSVLLPPKATLSSGESPKGVTPRDAPVMGKMLEAQAKLSPTSEQPEPKESALGEVEVAESERNPVSLATRLMEIFGFERPEEVISGTSIRKTVYLALFAD